MEAGSMGPQSNPALKTWISLGALPGRFTKEKAAKYLGTEYQSVSYYEGGFTEYLDFVRRKPECGLVKNAGRLGEYLTGDKGDWTGGSYQSLVARHEDFKQYNETKAKIQTDKLWKEVAFSFSEIMQRKRSRSEHDGEWEFDRKWDAEPYAARQKKPSTARIVKLNVEGSFSYGVDAEKINGFGAFVCAVVTFLEQNGVLVELNVGYTGTNYTSEASKTVFNIKLLVKKADEYLPPSQMLKCLSSNWYRRAVFGLIVASAENVDQPVDGSLGTPYAFNKKWERKDSELFIYSVPSLEQQHSIVKSLTDMFGKEENK